LQKIILSRLSAPIGGAKLDLRLAHDGAPVIAAFMSFPSPSNLETTGGSTRKRATSLIASLLGGGL
jgi:hypothetical protein